MGYRDLQVAVIKQAIQDYVNAKAYLARAKAPPNIDAVYKDIKAQYDEARSSCRVNEARKLNAQLSRLDAMKTRVDTCAEIESFLLSDECTGLYEVDGATILQRIKEMVA